MQRLYIALFLCLSGAFMPVFAALSPSDSLEMRIRNAAERGAVADDLGTAFYAQPGGEVLLLPPDKDLRFAILIYNIDLLPDRAEFSAGLAFRDGRSNQLVAFKTDNVRFYFKQGLTGPVRMQLMSDVLVKLGRAATVQFLGGYNQTWAEFDCKGLNQFGITAVARISNNVLVPVNAEHVAIPDSALTSRVQLQVKSWDELLVSVSLQPFQIRGFNGYVFTISKATLDLSADMNAAGMQLPENYRDPGFDNSWEGFYLAEGKLLFPRQFSQDSVSSTLAFRNLLLDERGFSGNVAGERILSPEKGRIAGWRFGIENAGITFYRNCLTKAELSGPLGLPVLPDTQYLRYNALLAFDDEYSFRVSTQNQVSFPAIKAGKVFLDSGSQVYLTAVRGDITARALLHGRLTISMKGNSEEKTPAAGLNDIAFQGLSISNKAPKFGIQCLGVGQAGDHRQSISRFPVTLYSASVSSENDKIVISFGLGVNFTDKLGCNTRFAIITELKNESKTDRLAFVGVRLDDLAIRAEISNIRFLGRISIMRSDPVYGDGFGGSIVFGVKLGTEEVAGSCKAIFGNVNSARYWYFDASLKVSGPGIPLAPAVALNGFMGGAWQGMRPLGLNEKPPDNTVGVSENGRIYVPDANAGLGLRAGVFLSSTAPGAFEANAALEIQFLTGGGLSSISLYGSAEFLIKPIPKEQSVFTQQSRSLCTLPNPGEWVAQLKPKGALAAAMKIELDFYNNIYTADLGMYVNVQAASMGLAGSYENGNAGRMSFFFSPTNWYVWLGNSLQPLSIIAKIPGAASMNATAYFMAGTNVPAAPKLPDAIAKAVGRVIASERNTEMLSKGVGFALGATLTYQIGGNYSDKKLAINASGSALAGFDILLQQYHSSVYCKQTGDIPGVNGWFAQGKFYVGATLNLGVSFQRHSINIANMSVGAVLHGQGPRPVYAEGLAGISINTWLVNYNGNIRVEMGKKCDLSETKYNAIPLVNIAEPAQGKDISILVQPRVLFAIPVGKEFQDVDQRRLRFKPDLMLTRGGSQVAGIWIIAENGEQADFQPAEPLQTFSGHTLLVTMYLEAWIPARSAWERIKQSGTEIIEQKSMSFTTSGALRNIPLNNITQAYPQIGQVNLHRDYLEKGYIALKVAQWQSLLTPGTRIVARFAAQNGECRDAAVEIKGNTAFFSIPKTLSNNKVYRFALLRRSANAPLLNVTSGFQEGSVSNVNAQMGISQQASSFNTKTIKNAVNSAMQPPQNAPDLLLLSYFFRTSVYPKPTEKWTDFAVSEVVSTPEQRLLELKQAGGEYLQLAELQLPAVVIKAELSRNSWFRQSVYPIVYGFFYRLPAGVRKGVNWGRDTIGGLIPNTISDFNQPGIEKIELKQGHYSSGKYDFGKTPIQCTYNGLKTIEFDLQSLKSSLDKISLTMDVATLERIIAVVPKMPPADVKQAGSMMQTPAPVKFNTGNNTAIKQGTNPPAGQVALRNRLLLALNALAYPPAPAKTVIPLTGTYKIGNGPAVSLNVGKGGAI